MIDDGFFVVCITIAFVCLIARGTACLLKREDERESIATRKKEVSIKEREVEVKIQKLEVEKQEIEMKYLQERNKQLAELLSLLVKGRDPLLLTPGEIVSLRENLKEAMQSMPVDVKEGCLASLMINKNTEKKTSSL